ncbi:MULTISPECIES: thioredoxin family protein [unclassified Pseudomonas]|uniref:thioredoxin family protein n=1 Tax=unclassified Pseudomonas TaxID=196821 RepID=UPI001304886B|nr:MULTISPECIES: thioredoxin family protein [unclassified Pseudomonas]MCO7504043.1 thioredoxin family protein [Pseudomonas sp. VE 267-6A]MCO7530777.1 thioredoxin family protein [Pseudomonas sp. 2]WEJ20853.1 thioredoxin family protein [Pseudomonas sp. SD17-1]
MSLRPVTRLDQLQALLDDCTRQRPAMVMVGSASCPPCRTMHPDVARLGSQHPQVDFHYFNVDLFEDHPQEPALTCLFQSLSLHYLPSHILLPVAGPNLVVCATSITRLIDALTEHHILRRAPFHARRPDHRLLQRHRPRPRRQLQVRRLRRVGDCAQGR